jgi:hypothetical protein
LSVFLSFFSCSFVVICSIFQCSLFLFLLVSSFSFMFSNVIYVMVEAFPLLTIFTQKLNMLVSMHCLDLHTLAGVDGLMGDVMITHQLHKHCFWCKGLWLLKPTLSVFSSFLQIGSQSFFSPHSCALICHKIWNP